MIKENSALVIITDNNDVLTQKEKNNIELLINAFKDNGKKVIEVITEGKKEASGIGDVVVKKRKLSAFFGTDMDILLKDSGISAIYIVGAYTDICVRSTAVDAHQNNYHFYVVTDAVYATTAQAQKCALWNMKYLQRESNVTTNEIVKEV